MNPKLTWLKNKLLSLNLEGMIVSNPVNIKYLTNIEAEGMLLITRKENIYITDGRYIEDVNSTLTIDDEIVVWDAGNISKEDYENFFLFCEHVGFEEDYVTYSKYKEYMHRFKINSLEETERIIEKQRMIKDPEEIEKITKACSLTDRCFSHLLGYIKKGMTERQIALEIERFFKTNGAIGLAFESVVASGPNSSKPHAKPTERELISGDVLLIDMGCVYQGYCSDMTRTIFIDYIPEKIRPVYDLVLKNQMQILKELKEGANSRILFNMVNGDFKLHDYILTHGLGHSLGMEIHEGPTIGAGKDNILKENMIITNEPGIYIPGEFGVRIEDTVLLTSAGCTRLTKSNKDYIIV